MGVCKITGRPLKFKSPEELQGKINAYFEDRDEKGKPYTVSSLCVFLDTTADTLLDYQNGVQMSISEEDKKRYSDTIKKAKGKILEYAEDHLYTKNNVTGVIFSLKNNYGWADKQVIETHNKDTVDEMSEEELKETLEKIEQLKGKKKK